MPRKPRAQQAKAQNAAQGWELREAYKKATEKVQNATVEGFEDDNHTHKTRSPEEDPDIVEIISEFVHIQEDDFTGYASGPDLEDYNWRSSARLYRRYTMLQWMLSKNTRKGTKDPKDIRGTQKGCGIVTSTTERSLRRKVSHQ